MVFTRKKSDQSTIKNKKKKKKKKRKEKVDEDRNYTKDETREIEQMNQN